MRWCLWISANIYVHKYVNAIFRTASNLKLPPPTLSP